MEIYPAIDLKDGRCVRLRQGLADQVTVYGDDPVAMARHWVEQGARRLHVVDLDGAFRGLPAHTDVIARITAAIKIPVQVGGGLRTEEQMQAVLDAGAARFVVGTRACADPGGLARLVARFGERLVVGIDARDGRVRVSGWVEASDLTPEALARHAAEAGVKTVIYTDTATDGMLTGPNFGGVRAVSAALGGAGLIASGGVATADDVRRLAAIGCPNLVGVIVGKALYEGRATLGELLAANQDSITRKAG